jgi:hypothetical protein
MERGEMQCNQSKNCRALCRARQNTRKHVSLPIRAELAYELLAVADSGSKSRFRVPKEEGGVEPPNHNEPAQPLEIQALRYLPQVAIAFIG